MAFPEFAPAGAILAELFRISFWGAAFILVLGIVLRFTSRGIVPPRVQCWLWWFACLRLLVSFAPIPDLRLEMPGLARLGYFDVARVLGAPEPLTVAVDDGADGSTGLPASRVEPSPASDPESDRGRRLLPSLKAVASTRPADFAPVLVALWLLGAGLGLAGLVTQHLRARRLLRNSSPWRDAGGESFAQLCRREGIAPVPNVLVSDQIRVPQITGIRSPTILLPAELFDRLDPVDREMALCHELAHLRRNDLLWGWAPTLAVRIFWFHPLVWLAAREYVVAREAACDLEVLRSVDAPPLSYGRLLLMFARSPRGLLPGAAGVGLGTSSLKRRLEMLRTSYRSDRAPLAWGALALAVALGILPVRLIGAPAQAKSQEKLNAQVKAEAEAEAKANAKTDARAKANATTEAYVEASVQAAAEAAAQAYADLTSQTRSKGKSRSTSIRSFDTGNEREIQSVIILSAGTDDITMMGSTDEIDDAKRAARKLAMAPNAIWFRTEDRAWLVDDEAIVETIREAFRPVEALGQQQGELGGRQGELGEKQGELGRRQGELGLEQARLSLLVSELSARIARRRQEGRRSDDLQAELEEARAEMEALSWAQGELGEMQGQLGEQQAELGEIQAELGERQQNVETKKLESTLDRVLLEAVRSGVARPAD